jgi:hypothetical protein
MGGMIDVSDDALSDDTKRNIWMDMAIKNAASLPPK